MALSTPWTLERAKNAFSEVVRRALDHQPQLVIRGGREEESVVVIAKSDYERLLAPPALSEFLARSPLAHAVRDGAFGESEDAELFPRAKDLGRDIPIE